MQPGLTWNIWGLNCRVFPRLNGRMGVATCSLRHNEPWCSGHVTFAGDTAAMLTLRWMLVLYIAVHYALTSLKPVPSQSGVRVSTRACELQETSLCRRWGTLHWLDFQQDCIEWLTKASSVSFYGRANDCCNYTSATCSNIYFFACYTFLQPRSSMRSCCSNGWMETSSGRYTNAIRSCKIK